MDYVEETIELDQDVYETLEKLAKERNQTIDETVNYILEKFLATVNLMSVDDLIKILEDYKEEETELPTCYIYDANKNPVAKFEPLI
jgi:predicted DNA-binding ribbon-helix-helix protein